MPVYEYSCAKCGTFEVSQRITDKPLRRCPSCSAKVQKLISSTSFHLKGSGWYVTDYGGKDRAGKKGQEESTTDSKPDSETAKAAKDSPAKPASKSKSESANAA